MQVIPVIDLLNGQVVYAQQGKRNTYRPIQSPLTSSSAPHNVIEAMLDYYAFETIYIADLNSIQQKMIEPQHYALIKALCKNYPSVTFWLDAGANTNQCFDQWSQLDVKPILGSENFTTYSDYAAIMQQTEAPEILSLDFINGTFMGAQEIYANASLWPESVIVMTLDQVGTNSGPHWQKLQEVKARNLHSNIVAAGGVKQIDDLKQLKATGIQGALIATALHHKQISVEGIAQL